LPHNNAKSAFEDSAGVRLVIPDSILKISKPLPEILFKNARYLLLLIELFLYFTNILIFI
jgi:hypothetical protein